MATQMISDNGHERYEYTQTHIIRWAVPKSDPEAIRLQQCWSVVVYDSQTGKALRQERDWRNVDFVEIDE